MYKRQIQETIPLSWIKLIEERDEFLIELLSDKVESMCGYKPPGELITDFLTKVLNNPMNRAATNKKSISQPQERLDPQSSVLTLTSPERPTKASIVYLDQKPIDSKTLLLNPDNPCDLKFTAVEGTIGGKPGENWKQLVIQGIGLALNHGHDIYDLHVNVVKGKYTEKGYAYASHLNISVQDIDANRAFKTLLQIAKMLECELELKVTWTKKSKSKLPGEHAKLQWP